MAKKQPLPDAGQLVDLHFPLAGIDLSGSFDRQPNRPTQTGYARTTVQAKNVRGYIPLSDRAVGGSRAGLTKRVPAQVSTTHVIQELALIVGTGFDSPFTPPTTGLGSILVQGPTTGKAKLISPTGSVIATTSTLGNVPVAVGFDSQGNAYVAGGTNASPSALNVVKYSSGGTLIWSTSVPMPNGQTTPLDLVATPDGNIHISTTRGDGSYEVTRINQQSSVAETNDEGMISQQNLPATTKMSATGSVLNFVPNSASSAFPSLIQVGGNLPGGKQLVSIKGVNGGAVSGRRAVGGEAGSTYVSVIDTTNTGASKPSGVAKLDPNGNVIWTAGYLYDGSNALNWYNSHAGVDYPLDLAYNSDVEFLYAVGQYEAGPNASYNLIAIDRDDGSISASDLPDAGGIANSIAAYTAEAFGVIYASGSTVRLMTTLLTEDSNFSTTAAAVPIAVAPFFN